MPSTTSTTDNKTLWSDIQDWSGALLIGVSITGIIAALIFIVYPFIFQPSPMHLTPEAFLRSSCNTSACIRFADILSRTVNHSADPCVDFYRYTCSNLAPGSVRLRTTLIRQAALQELFSRTASNVSLGRGKAIKLYNACVQGRSKGDLEALRAFLGGYKLLLGNDRSLYAEPLDVMFLMASKMQEGILIHLDLDFKYSLSPTATGLLEQSPSALPFRLDVNRRYRHWVDSGARAFSTNLITDVLLLVWESIASHQSFLQTAEEINVTKEEVRIQIQRAFRGQKDRRDLTVYLKDASDFCQYLTTGFLRKYLTVQNATNPEDTLITVAGRGFFRFIDGMLLTINPRKLSAFLSWELARQLYHTFDKDNHEELKSPCYIAVEDLLGAGATLGPLSFQHVNDAAKKIGGDIAGHVRTNSVQSIRRIVGRNNAETAHLEGTAHRLEGTTIRLVYPGDVRSEQDSDRRLGYVTVTNGSFIDNLLSISEARWRRTKQRGAEGRLEWIGVDSRVEYDPRKWLLVPATYLLPPLFTTEGYQVTNFGSFGWPVAEEIWHVLRSSHEEELNQQARTYMAGVFSNDTRCLRRREGSVNVSSVFHATAMASVVRALNSSMAKQDDVSWKAALQLLFVSSCLGDCGADVAEVADVAERCNTAAMNVREFAKAFECSDKDNPGQDAFCGF